MIEGERHSTAHRHLLFTHHTVQEQIIHGSLSQTTVVHLLLHDHRIELPVHPTNQSLVRYKVECHGPWDVIEYIIRG